MQAAQKGSPFLTYKHNFTELHIYHACGGLNVREDFTQFLVGLYVGLASKMVG